MCLTLQKPLKKQSRVRVSFYGATPLLSHLLITLRVLPVWTAVLRKQRGLPNFGNAGAVKTLAREAMQRAVQRDDSDITIDAEDFVDEGLDREDDPLDLLDDLINIDNVRNKLKQLRNQLSLSQAEGDAKPKPGHFIFTGNPGTGW